MRLERVAEREYRTWQEDSRRWRAYRPREGDIVIATYPKCGTTWTQRIVGGLVFGDLEPRPYSRDISIWLDRRFRRPLEEDIAALEAQTHLRFLKAHLPFDGLPIYDGVKYIHVARDGRDAALSWHNHASGYTDAMLELLDAAGREDATIGRPLPRAMRDPADEFHRWLTEGAHADWPDGTPNTSYFGFQAELVGGAGARERADASRDLPTDAVADSARPRSGAIEAADLADATGRRPIMGISTRLTGASTMDATTSDGSVPRRFSKAWRRRSMADTGGFSTRVSTAAGAGCFGTRTWRSKREARALPPECAEWLRAGRRIGFQWAST